MVVLIFGLLAGIAIDEEYCAWEILDADHFHRLSWKAETGEEYVIGILPEASDPFISDPVFLRPTVPQVGDPCGGAGHIATLKLCSTSFVGAGNVRTPRFSTIWDPLTQLYLVTFDPLETLEEVSSAYERVQAKFRAGTLHYWPRSFRQLQEAESWPPGSIPLVLNLEERRFVAYAVGATYGRLRMVSIDDWPRVHAEGSLTRQDIVLLQEAPFDFDARIGGAITCMPQGPLSHVNLICLQEGTPNAYVAGAWELLAPYADKLVRLEVRETNYTIREAEIEDAERLWAARRSEPLAIAPPDLSYRELPSLVEIAGTYRADRFGGKGAYLAHFLPAIPAEHRVPGFVIPFSYLQEFLETSRLGDLSFRELLDILDRDERFQTDSRYRREALAAFQQVVEDQGRVSQELVGRVAARTREVFGSTNLKVRFRSSSNAEDALLFPGAGLYDSYSACADDSFDPDGLGPCRCDPNEPEERTIERALRKVWASLWNFRAVEQRRWHGIPEDRVRMGILVAPAFLAEAANGVALTGSPTNPVDGRYFVTVQPGEASVVRPSPGDVPELDLVAAGAGGSFTIERARPSNLVPVGQFVMSDGELAALGTVLRSLAQSYTPPPPFTPELVRLDVEFKVSPDRSIAVKQVRPYCLPGAAKFVAMLVPQTCEFGGQVFVNAAQGNLSAREELERRTVLRLREPSITLSAVDAFATLPCIEEITGAGTADPYRPLGDAEVTLETDLRSWVAGVVSLAWSLEQELTTLAGDRIEARSDLARLSLNLWEAEKPVLASRATFQVSRDGKTIARYLPLKGTAFAVHRLAIELAGGDSVDFLMVTPSPGEAEGAALLGARGNVRGVSFLVEGPSRLAIGEGPRPVRTAHLVVVGEERLHALSVEFVIGDTEPAVVILDSGFNVVEKLTIAAWSRRHFSLPDSPALRRGDANGDGRLNAVDAIRLLDALFGSHEAVRCADAADANDDGRVNVCDAVLLLRHAYAGPVLPGTCEPDATEDALARCQYDPWACMGN